ncbi:MAG: alpha/beta hydrolase [Alphaproteobacteria bacterium]|nr:alpha/beta hydrolase [Alphaproteobacteria bacterium]MBU1516218.1 alpha/beta hydrolase [Alphaproteobacteria bacterium]MBU2095755.1 alpha/beta hydrolase [Alphaproteobacteria bacterium]MBU2154040.1 alpha/beta hydrolase [Alphaproteobacteria bacterium]MBU2306846.1 alpha/beta hydrolase [Alphaproteobacteria bacterium]
MAHRGETVDIGGRRLRIVRAGLAAGPSPLIVCEHGAFGCASDWAVVQEKLTARGLRSLAYDRAGLGYSDAGPAPRDGRAINDDLEALLRALGESGPILLVGHSMGGLMVRLFALEREHELAGLVMVDAVTPDVFGLPGGATAIRGFGRFLQVVSHGAKLGLMVPVSLVSGNMIGLPGQAGAEKRRIHGSASHAHGAAAEVIQWPETSRMAGAVELPVDLPVAVVTAGPHRGRGPLKAIQEKPAKSSRAGFIEHVEPSNHANLLGPRYADAIVRGVEQVLQAGSR